MGYYTKVVKICAHFLTWTTYGSWLPGDQRGWIDRHNQGSIQNSDPGWETLARKLMKETSVILNKQQRAIVHSSISRTCNLRSWKVHALAVCSNHIHVLISCPDKTGSQLLSTLKAHCTRVLKGHSGKTQRMHWWTRSGNVRSIFRKESLNMVIEYIENQRS